MQGILKVDPKKLSEAAELFKTQATTVNGKTQEMLSIVAQSMSIWQGDAANAYNSKFKGLETDMSKLYKMITTHADALQEMAAEYISAETKNEQTSAALHANILA